ncbi:MULTISPECIES: MerR family transcriptional regulator [Asticcacaulis]|uniref:MerR family transcriptional regulator n=1 Tax=Asticcacaulis TaxID=76890 RepID=UPI001AEA95DE|nr:MULTISPECIES: MerR family transcriptional regulator [Asticcacaulis]MBP2159098.1 DNA-binding transcriptional MerR regulator [Asticcacaulis solisilvae]MDR6800143.1 DNA-binding transcriptional MerR regulator [Asticcacaulis sp. BE141]
MISIGELARRAQCTVPTVRYYESIGLLPKAQRREGGHRAYDRADLARLNLIRRCRDCDIPIERIRELVSLSEGQRLCGETVAFFEEQRRVIQARIDALKELDLTLSLHLQSCRSNCLPNGDPCEIFDQLQA